MSRPLHAFLSVTLLTSLPVALVMAEEGGGGAQPNVSLFNIIVSSPVAWVLIAISVAGMAMGIHRLITIKRDQLVPDGLADDLHNIFAEGISDEGVEDALNMVAGDESILGQVFAAALDKREFGFGSMQEAAESVGNAEHNKYMAQISWLSLLAAIGPMLGLLGTVVGMIGAFMKMATTAGNVDPASLANDIGGAMITTAIGLIIAIPMMFLFFLLRARINACVLDATVLTNEVLDYFRPQT